MLAASAESVFLSERQLWWGLAAALIVAAFSAVAVAQRGVLDGPAYFTFWFSMTAAWATGGGLLAAQPHHQPRWTTAGFVAGLLLLNPIAAFLGGFLLAPLSWIVLAVVLVSERGEALRPGS